VLLPRCNVFCDRVVSALEQIATERRAQFAVPHENGGTSRIAMLRTFSKSLDEPLGIELRTSLAQSNVREREVSEAVVLYLTMRKPVGVIS
jgi:hypothetical protein